MEGIIGGTDPLTSVHDTLRDGHFDEIIVSTLPKKTSKWLRRDLIRQIAALGLPVTTVTPTRKSDGVGVDDETRRAVVRETRGGVFGGF